MSFPESGVPGRAHRATEPLHAMIYFAPEAEQELTGIGLRPGRMGYFASRSAAMGAVSAGVVTATFYNFHPDLVARHIPRAWTLASPEAVIGARAAAVDKALHRLLGPSRRLAGGCRAGGSGARRLRCPDTRGAAALRRARRARLAGRAAPFAVARLHAAPRIPR